MFSWVLKKLWSGECDSLVQVKGRNDGLNKLCSVRPLTGSQVEHIIKTCLSPFPTSGQVLIVFCICGACLILIAKLLVCECHLLLTLSDQLVWPCCILLSSMWVAVCIACYKPAADACPLLSRMWVAAMPCCLSSLLMMPDLCFSDGGWLPYFAEFQACWWCLPSTLQDLSGSHASLCFKPATDACPLFSRECVVAMPCLSQSKVLVHDRPILSLPLNSDTSKGSKPLVVRV